MCCSVPEWLMHQPLNRQVEGSNPSRAVVGKLISQKSQRSASQLLRFVLRAKFLLMIMYLYEYVESKNEKKTIDLWQSRTQVTKEPYAAREPRFATHWYMVTWLISKIILVEHIVLENRRSQHCLVWMCYNQYKER